MLELDSLVDASRLGGKAKGLQTALRVGLAVPPTLAIELPEFTDGSSKTIQNWATGVGQDISAWARLNRIRHLVLRSSGYFEDSDSTSFAGLFPSRFTSASESAVQTALHEMLLGLSSKGLEAYSRARGVSRNPDMTFLVQPTVPPLRSGVAFVSPHGNVVDLTVQCTWGLALDLVKGLMTGDTYDSRRAVDSALTVGSKTLAVYPLICPDEVMPGDHVTIRLTPDSTGISAKLVFVDEVQALAYVRIPSAASQRLALSSETLTTLRTHLSHAAQTLGISLDVEWVQAIDGRIYTVQMRPVTAQLAPPKDLRTRGADKELAFIGEPGAPGKFTGPIRHWGSASPSTADLAVLVCAGARPEMLPEILRSGAIVSSDAGILSHVAILARELEKPCVLGASALPAWAKDGAVVAVDGAAGKITKVAQVGSATGADQTLDQTLSGVRIALWPDRLAGHNEEEQSAEIVLVLLTHEWLEVIKESTWIWAELGPRSILIFHESTDGGDDVAQFLCDQGFVTGAWSPWSVAVTGISIESAAGLLDSLGLRHDS